MMNLQKKLSLIFLLSKFINLIMLANGEQLSMVSFLDNKISKVVGSFLASFKMKDNTPNLAS